MRFAIGISLKTNTHQLGDPSAFPTSIMNSFERPITLANELLALRGTLDSYCPHRLAGAAIEPGSAFASTEPQGISVPLAQELTATWES